MHSSLRYLLVTAHLYSLAIMLQYLHPNWLNELRSLSHLLGDYRRCQELQMDTEAILTLEQSRKELVRNLAAGQLSLREAAARLRVVDRRFSAHTDRELRSRFAGLSDEERYCWRMVFVARAELSLWGEQRSEVIARLEAELRETLGSHRWDQEEWLNDSQLFSPRTSESSAE